MDSQTTLLVIAAGVVVAAGLGVLIYRWARTYDGSEHHTYVTQKEGKDTKAILAPTTLWNPQIKVLKKLDAPDLTILTRKPGSPEYVEQPLVARPSGQISLRIHTCTPRPFPAMTLDRHRVQVKATVIFQIDPERIEVVCQLADFGSALAARVENLFDNEIGKYRDEELRAHQTKIETAVTKTMQAIEQQSGDLPFMGIPFGIHVYEASFAFEEMPPASLDPAATDAPAAAGGGPGAPRGVMWLNDQQLDRIADVFKDRDPAESSALMRMLELQTRQNIVQLISQAGGLVGFSAKELGLSDIIESADRAAMAARIEQAAIDVDGEPVSGPANGRRNRAASTAGATPAAPTEST